MALAAVTLLLAGATDSGIFVALRVTGRWSFLWFWLAFIVATLPTLFGPAFRPWAVRGREFGLGYASAQTVHVALLVWLYCTAARPPVPQSVLVFFGVGVFWTYLLALLSFGGFARLFDARVVRVLRTIGVYYIGFAFFKDLARNPFHGGLVNLILYLPFTVLIGVALSLRLAAMVRRQFQDKRAPA
jgi:hypothetical protein